MKKKLIDVLGIKYPIFQAPMAGGITSPGFVGSISDFGMFGSIASGYLSLAQVEDFIRKVKEKTSRPFSVNLFVDYTQYVQRDYSKPQEIVDIEKELGLFSTPDYTVTQPPSIDDLVELVIREKVPVISTTFGLLSSAHSKKLRQAGVVIFTTVNSTSEIVETIDSHKSNFFIYQNSLAGGHMGGFANANTNTYSKEEEILHTIKNHTDTYVVLAGGVVDRKDIQLALNRGFDGVQIGTAFLTTQESSAPDSYKKAIVDQELNETITTQSITGKSARGLSNQIARLDIDDNPGFPLMHYATSELRQYAKQQGLLEFQSLWAGANSYKTHKISTLEKFMESLIK